MTVAALTLWRAWSPQQRKTAEEMHRQHEGHERIKDYNRRGRRSSGVDVADGRWQQRQYARVMYRVWHKQRSNSHSDTRCRMKADFCIRTNALTENADKMKWRNKRSWIIDRGRGGVGRNVGLVSTLQFFFTIILHNFILCTPCVIGRALQWLTNCVALTHHHHYLHHHHQQQQQHHWLSPLARWPPASSPGDWYVQWSSALANYGLDGLNLSRHLLAVLNNL